MKYYSEVLNKVFDSEDEVISAEAEYADELKKQEENKKLVSKEKKALAQEIEDADVALDKAYKVYEDAKQQVVEVKREADKKCQDIMKEAKKQLKDAQDVKFAKVQKFNDAYGPYSVSYTGDRALKEMNRHLSWFDDIINSFWF